MHFGAVHLQIAGSQERLLTHVALIKPDIAVVHIGVVPLHISGTSELLRAHVARINTKSLSRCA